MCPPLSSIKSNQINVFEIKTINIYLHLWLTTYYFPSAHGTNITWRSFTRTTISSIFIRNRRRKKATSKIAKEKKSGPHNSTKFNSHTAFSLICSINKEQGIVCGLAIRTSFSQPHAAITRQSLESLVCCTGTGQLFFFFCWILIIHYTRHQQISWPILVYYYNIYPFVCTVTTS